MFDVIGDIHGELPALQALGRALGYSEDWVHPQGRLPVFLGDLVDRGAHSLATARLVMNLVNTRRAFCIMGNHEYNLVAWSLRVPGYEGPKSSNRDTIAEIKARPNDWSEVLAFFAGLPMALNLPDLRVIHACWHKRSLAAVTKALTATPEARADDRVGYLERHVALVSPFAGNGIRDGLPQDLSNKDDDVPHENLMKGFEVRIEDVFTDNDGHARDRIRAVWWRDDRDQVLNDKPQVFGHYWNLPPIEGDFAPPHPSGHPKLREWATRVAAKCPPNGRMALQGDYACVDFNGFTKASGQRACVGALQWPEREIVWATADR